MSDSPQGPWSNNPNAPQIPRSIYHAEKENFAGNLSGAILYGIVVALFFRCMGALLDPINRTKQGVKWGLVVHTAAMFSIVTMNTGINLHLHSLSNIDNRDFPGIEGALPPGPLAYMVFIFSATTNVIANATYQVNQWLADGLLLYRCYIIYAMSYWVIAFPCLMYLGSLVTGIMFAYQSSRPDSGVRNSTAIFNFTISYFSISLSLNIILTLMIVVRLLLHSRNVRKATGGQMGATGLYKAVVTMLIESSALYAITSLLFIGPWGAKNSAADIFSPILTETQVIAPFLIILRVANRSALTTDAIVSGNVGSIHFQSQEQSMAGNGTISDENHMGFPDTNEETPCEFSVDEVPL